MSLFQVKKNTLYLESKNYVNLWILQPHSCTTWQLFWLFSVISGPVRSGHNAPLCYCRFGSLMPPGLPYSIENTMREVKENQSPNKWVTDIQKTEVSPLFTYILSMVLLRGRVTNSSKALAWDEEWWEELFQKLCLLF